MAAKQEKIYAVTPGGRIVWGDPYKKVTTDYDGNPYPEGEGPVEFGLAIRKDAPGIGDLLTKMYQQSINGYPGNNYLQQAINQHFTRLYQPTGIPDTSFRAKIKDGDLPNREGRIDPNQAGCFVIAFKTFQPLKYTHYGFEGVFGVPNDREISPEHIYTGCYADVNMSFAVNGNTDGTAGLYVNPHAVRLLGNGQRIVGGMSTEQAFAGQAPAYIPPGASMTPVSPSTGAAPQQQPQQFAQQQPAAPGLPPMGNAPQQQQNPQFVQPGQVAAGHAPMTQPGGFAPTPGNPAIPSPSNGAPQFGQQPQQQPAGNAPAFGNAPLMTPSPSNGVPSHPGFLQPPVPGQ